jgi:hypothetical protein
MFKNKSGYLTSWLKHLDIEYISNEFAHELAVFDINNRSDQDIIIELAIVPGFTSCNDISKKSMLTTLEELPDYPECEVRRLLASVGMPFNESLNDYKTFFEKVKRRCAEL